MILVSDRRSEDGHNAITQYLIYRTFKAVHRLHHHVNGRVEKLLSIFRVEASNQLGRIFDVGKQPKFPTSTLDFRF
jgi:hypothetical protein